MRLLNSVLLILPAGLMAEMTLGQSIDVLEFLIMLITAVCAGSMALISSRSNGKMEVLQTKLEALQKTQMEVLETKWQSLHGEILTIRNDLNNWREFCQQVQQHKLEEWRESKNRE